MQFKIHKKSLASFYKDYPRCLLRNQAHSLFERLHFSRISFQRFNHPVSPRSSQRDNLVQIQPILLPNPRYNQVINPFRDPHNSRRNNQLESPHDNRQVNLLRNQPINQVRSHQNNLQHNLQNNLHVNLPDSLLLAPVIRAVSPLLIPLNSHPCILGDDRVVNLPRYRLVGRPANQLADLLIHLLSLL